MGSSVAEFQQLMKEIQQELADMKARMAELTKTSSTPSLAVKNAEASVRNAAKKTMQKKMTPKSAKSVQKSLTNATRLLGGFLDDTKIVAKKAEAAVNAGRPLAERIRPLLDKIGTALWWAGKLWLK